MIYFFSDVHLGLLERDKDREIEDLLLAFLDKASENAETIAILGDLFDYWFEYKTVVPKYFYRTLTKLESLVRRGIEIVYVMGNHDFGHLDFFEKELGIPVHDADIEREFYGKKFYLSHGDGKALNDAGYLVLKKILRSPLSNKLYRKIHPDCGIGLASSSSKTSRTYTDKRTYGVRDGLQIFAEKKISEGFDYVVMGHMHLPKFVPIEKGYYLNLGAWFEEAVFGMFDGERLSLNKTKEFI